MKSFRQYIKEEGPANGTGMFGYGFNFQMDTVPTDFDVENYSDDGMKRTKLPWEVENAVHADRRQKMIMLWSKAAGANSKQAVSKSSLPQTPKWQSHER